MHSIFGLNWIDIVILLILSVLVWRGIKDGLATQLLASGGFFVGLFIGGWLFARILPIHDKHLLYVVNYNLVVGLALVLCATGFWYGRRLHHAFESSWLHGAETYLSIIFSVASGLVAVWLVTSMISRLPFAGFSNSVNSSLVIQILNSRMPPVPAIVAVLDKQVNPNDQPQVYVKSKAHEVERFIPGTPSQIRSAGSRAGQSVVLVTSFGCGGIVSGSGFVASPGFVMTNAHVIAGVRRPIVKLSGKSYEATPLLFNPTLDVAVLRVDGLQAKPLSFEQAAIAAGTPIVSLGYPSGNYTVSSGKILELDNVYTDNIYGTGQVNRLIYEFQADISKGNSGGPIILLDGKVAGMVFAKSGAGGKLGFALPAASITQELERAQAATHRTGTGACVAH
jgi:S1-C subfamily serine protease